MRVLELEKRLDKIQASIDAVLAQKAKIQKQVGGRGPRRCLHAHSCCICVVCRLLGGLACLCGGACLLVQGPLPDELHRIHGST